MSTSVLSQNFLCKKIKIYELTSHDFSVFYSSVVATEELTFAYSTLWGLTLTPALWGRTHVVGTQMIIRCLTLVYFGVECVCVFQGVDMSGRGSWPTSPLLFPLANRKLPPLLVRTRPETSVAYFETLAHCESHIHQHTQLDENNLRGKSAVWN